MHEVGVVGAEVEAQVRVGGEGDEGRALGVDGGEHEQAVGAGFGEQAVIGEHAGAGGARRGDQVGAAAAAIIGVLDPQLGEGQVSHGDTSSCLSTTSGVRMAGSSRKATSLTR